MNPAALACKVREPCETRCTNTNNTSKKGSQGPTASPDLLHSTPCLEPQIGLKHCKNYGFSYIFASSRILKLSSFIFLELSPMLGNLGPSWGRLGAVLGLSWAVLGPSWAVLGRLGRVLGASWARLGPLLSHLGSLLGPSWTVLGPFWGPLGAFLEPL